ncbi:polysaccharide deacetylase family protein [Calidifontibacillus erzurumensis]|uniref:Polysaccharide deacetylase family protein n=1 Tax=Calidifontibacillus erzurumensis TaxID=2741433 RepID=A0A8J8GE45_9BACI|nr:polysaccharide deacetylase family protein [Calidifontibacillus erzurumensis]NSL50718.1 polysaccharide deacetylase family protein [Calidifontibacillus erzurumensis]
MKWGVYLYLILILLLLTACAYKMDSNSLIEDENTSVDHKMETSAEDRENNKDEDEHKGEDMQNNEMIEIEKPKYRVNPTSFAVEPLNESNENVVLLTIDDAPDKHALEMAKILKQLNVQAIFFVNGHFLKTDEQKAVLKEIYDMGFMIGNHTMTHANLKKLPKEKQYEEIVKLNDLVEEITGERPKFFRAPFGANTDFSRQIVLEEKMVLMNWTYGYDFLEPYMTKDAIREIMVNTNLLQDGANLLMHDREWTKDALKDIVIGLKNKGFEIVDPHVIETIH